MKNLTITITTDISIATLADICGVDKAAIDKGLIKHNRPPMDWDELVSAVSANSTIRRYAAMER